MAAELSGYAGAKVVMPKWKSQQIAKRSEFSRTRTTPQIRNPDLSTVRQGRSSAVSLASWLRESPIGSRESGTAKPSAKHFWQSCRLSWPSLNPRSCRSLNTRRRRSQFVDQPPNPFISVGVLLPHHLNVYCLWCVGQIQEYEGKMRSAPKCESAR